jgi:hypothetical protein
MREKTTMAKKPTKKPLDWIETDLGDDDVGGRQRRRIEPDERDDYDDWRREQGSRGRKPRGKAGDRHQRRRSHDDEV